MFGHSFWLQPAAGRTEPILKFTGLEYTGSLSVYSFFLLSGIMVTSSFDRQRSIVRFVALRLARIYPGLIACVFLTAYLLYPSLSTMGFAETVRGHDAAHYFSANVKLFSGIQATLPGIFETAPLRYIVNGSLWTLPIELKCYMIVFCAGILGCFRAKWRSIAFTAAASIGFAYLVSHGTSIEFLRDLAGKPTGYSFYAPPFFLLGMLLYTYKDRVVLNWTVAALLGAAYLVFRASPIAPLLFYSAFVYGMLTLGVTTALRRFAPRNDYSYGIYLWAFPIQQIVASRYPQLDNLISLTITMPATIAIAAASWHLIEKPCVSLLRSGRFSPVQEVTAAPIPGAPQSSSHTSHR
ncbi:hypothetical protein WK25_06170 [Burkholderia latens]|nr:hypothetical protein WK25_06170 [Burkholderia latens]